MSAPKTQRPLLAKAEVLKRLEHLRLVQKENIKGVERKRSWRESEKAMSIVEYQMRLQALDYAIMVVTEQPEL
jgi:hypothetical protein